MLHLHFHRDCVWATIGGRISPEFADALNKALSYFEPGYAFTKLYKLHRWDGKRYLLDRKTMTFPAGLAYRVMTTAKRLLGDDYHVEVQDDRPLPPWGIVQLPGGAGSVTVTPRMLAYGIELNGISLHPDQREAIETALEARRGSLCLATGFGKTEVAAAIMKAVSPARGIFLVNKKTLLTQTADRFEDRMGGRVGRIGAGYRTPARVTVATVQTLYQHLDEFKHLLSNQQVLIYDEAHTIAPGMSFPVLQAIHAPVRLGLSATIKEASRRMAVEAFLGPILMEHDAHDLIEAGRAAVPAVWMVRVGGQVTESFDWHLVEDQGIVYNDARNSKIVQAVKDHVARGLQVLVLVIRIPHGEALRQELKCAGLDVPFLHGQTPLSDVDQAKRDFGRGTLSALLASTIFDFGQDLPSIQVLILAGGGRSPLRTIQRAGRALRKKPDGKNTVTIIDFYDMANGLLRQHSEERFRTYKRKKFPVQVVATLAESV